MNSHLVDLEQRAIELKNAGKLKEAAHIFREIVEQQPDWEHGTAWYNLAECHENLQDYESAESYYGKALKYEPRNPYFLGGLGALLYAKSEFARAFDVHLTLLEIEQASGSKGGVSRTTTALKAIGQKMGLSGAEIESRVRDKMSRP